jgi:hypothetical protein
MRDKNIQVVDGIKLLVRGRMVRPASCREYQLQRVMSEFLASSGEYSQMQGVQQYSQVESIQPDKECPASCRENSQVQSLHSADSIR